MIDTGNTAFMLLATSLVMLMTPGLAFFYGGLVGRKNVLAIMMQSFVSMGITTIIWVAIGYSLCFSGDVGGVVGNLDNAFLMGIDSTTAFSGFNGIPLYVFVAYQMMFAIITPALITGASGGIGLELARIHASEGDNMVLVARSADKLEQLSKDLEARHEISIVIIA